MGGGEVAFPDSGGESGEGGQAKDAEEREDRFVHRGEMFVPSGVLSSGKAETLQTASKESAMLLARESFSKMPEGAHWKHAPPEIYQEIELRAPLATSIKK